MSIPVRLSENNQTDQQLRQRDRTYEAADLLRRAGFACSVIEYFVTGPTDTSASIVIEGQSDE